MKICRSLLLLMIFISPGLSSKAQDAEAVAGQFMNMLGAGKAGDAYYMMDSTVQSKVTPVQLGLIWQQLETKYGSWKSMKIRKSGEEQAKDIGIFLADNDFEKAVLTMKIVVNTPKKIVGFTIGKIDEKSGTKTPVPAGLTEQPVTVTADGGHIQGTITLPASGDKWPVVLIIAGSGPTDRDGNNMLGVTAQSYRLLAYDLAQKGIASLRYDKRDLGGSTDFKKPSREVVVEDFADDAVQSIKLLKHDKRFTKVFVIGHSEGALIGMMAVAKVKVDGYVSLCGAGESLDKTLDGQMKVTMPDQYQEGVKLIAALKADSKLPPVSDGLKLIFNDQTAIYLHSLFRYDPQTLMKEIKVPALIVAGNHDLQIGERDSKMLSRSNAQAKLVVIDSMNHILKASPAEANANLKTYTDPTHPVHPQLVSRLSDFIFEHSMDKKQ